MIKSSNYLSRYIYLIGAFFVMVHRESRYVPATPELLAQDREQTKVVSEELIKAITPIMEKHFDKQMVSLDVYMGSFRTIVSYFLAEAVHSVPVKEKPMVLSRIRDSFGTKIAACLLMVAVDNLGKDFEKFVKENP